MSRNVPIALQNPGSALTRTWLLRIDPVSGLDPVGFCGTNRDIPFGGLVYSAAVGFEPSTIVQSGDLSVDNAEARSLLPVYDAPISEADILAGMYDYARFWLYEVNYLDLAAGYVLKHFGELGQMKMRDGLSFVSELRDLVAKLRQAGIVRRDSITCRDDFGGPVCGIDLGPLWITGTVDSVGAEPSRVIVLSEAVAAANTYRHGMVQALTGANAGLYVEIEESAGTGALSLRFPARFDFAPGDSVRFRIGCGKRFLEDCIGVHGNGLNFDGEPHMPLGDAGTTAVPGGQDSGGATVAVNPSMDAE